MAYLTGYDMKKLLTNSIMLGVMSFIDTATGEVLFHLPSEYSYICKSKSEVRILHSIDQPLLNEAFKSESIEKILFKETKKGWDYIYSSEDLDLDTKELTEYEVVGTLNKNIDVSIKEIKGDFHKDLPESVRLSIAKQSLLQSYPILFNGIKLNIGDKFTPKKITLGIFSDLVSNVTEDNQKVANEEYLIQYLRDDSNLKSIFRSEASMETEGDFFSSSISFTILDIFNSPFLIGNSESAASATFDIKYLGQSVQEVAMHISSKCQSSLQLNQ